MSAAVSFAFAAGLLATVNPCGFALLPSFLSFYLGADEDRAGIGSVATRMRQGLLVGVVLSAAFGGVFVFAGLVVSAGMRAFIQAVPWLAVVIGAALVVLGLAMLAGRHVGLTAASRVPVDAQGGRSYGRVALFGVTYALASLSCTLAIFLVVVGQALAVSDPVQLLAVFGAYAAGSASILVALSLSAALAKAALARAVRRLVPVVNRLAGALLAASGVYLLLYWIPALGSGGAVSDSRVANASKGISSTLADFFTENVSAFALVLGALAVLGAALVLLELRPKAGAAGAGLENESENISPLMTKGIAMTDDCCTPASSPARLDEGADAEGPEVEILYFDGCPNHDTAFALVERIAGELGVRPRIRLVNVPDAAAAAELRFLGSPTVRVGGRDVEPGADERTDYALSCRIFGTDAGMSGEPDEQWVRDAFRREGAVTA